MLTKLRTYEEENEAGFTIIELLTVVLIIGILSAIAIPFFMNQRKSAVDASVESDVRNAGTALTQWTLSNPQMELTEFPITPQEGIASGESPKTPLAFISAASLFQGSTPTVVRTQAELKDQIKVSEGNTLFVKPGLSGEGFCIYGVNSGGDKAANEAGITYDSLAGGLNKSGVACAKTAPSDVDQVMGGGNLPLPEEHTTEVTTATGKKVTLKWTAENIVPEGKKEEDSNALYKVTFTATPAVTGWIEYVGIFGESDSKEGSAWMDAGKSVDQYTTWRGAGDAVFNKMDQIHIDDTVTKGNTYKGGESHTMTNVRESNEYGLIGVTNVVTVTYDKDAPTRKVKISGTTKGQITDGFIAITMPNGMDEAFIIKVTDGAFSSDYYVPRPASYGNPPTILTNTTFSAETFDSKGVRAGGDY